MPLISRIEVMKKPKQPVILIKKTSDIENLHRLIVESRRKIHDYLNEIGEYPGDKPYIKYFNMNMEDLENMDTENLEVEIGVPVYKELPGKKDIEPGYLPEMKAIYTMYQGIYQEMSPSYYEVIKWAEKNNLEFDGTFIEFSFTESFNNGSDDDLFEIIFPLKTSNNDNK